MNSLDHYRALHESAGYFRRADRGRLRLTGADRLAYLHGLLTNDIASLSPGRGCYAALLTPQGRMMADLRVFETGASVLIDLDQRIAADVREHLDKFVITEDVIVNDVSERTGQVGIYGPAAAGAVSVALRELGALVDATLLEDLATFANHTTEIDGAAAYLLRSDDIGIAGVDVVLPSTLVSSFETALSRAAAVPVAVDAVEMSRIEAGIPKFLVDMDTTTIPLEAGIEDRAISMTKGCYVGQEVIIRVLHRGGGRVAKKLVQLRSSARIERDDRILSGVREVGRITSAAASPKFGGFVALGYVAREFAAPDARLEVRGEGVEIGNP